MPDTTRVLGPPGRGTALARTVAVFGVPAGLAGVEHGIGEIAQGDVAPAGVLIASWPGPGPFRVLAGEPAMTLVPNLLVTGILAVVTSLVLLVVAVSPLVGGRLGGPALIGSSVLMLLVGAGFGPPLLGIVVGVAASRTGAPPHGCIPAGVRAVLAAAWPWCLGVALAGWLALLPGTVLFERFVGMGEAADPTVALLTPTAFTLLLLTIVTASARNCLRHPARVRSGTNGPGGHDRDAAPWAPSEGGTVFAEQGDRIVVESVHLDAGRRYGEVLEVLGDGETRHYRVRWQDGHESVYFPGPDARLADRG